MLPAGKLTRPLLSGGRLARGDGFLETLEAPWARVSPSRSPLHSQKGSPLTRKVAQVRKTRSAGQRRPFGPLQEPAVLLSREIWSPPAFQAQPL